MRVEELSEATARLELELLNPAIHHRLGAGEDGLRRIKTHAYFDGIDWIALLARPEPGPIKVARLTLSQGQGQADDTLTDAAALERRRARPWAGGGLGSGADE